MRTKLPKVKSIKNKHGLTVAVTVIAVGSLIWLGVQLERSTYQPPLPANQSCLTAIENTSKLLAGENVDVLKHVQACRETSDKYEVVVK